MFRWLFSRPCESIQIHHGHRRKQPGANRSKGSGIFFLHIVCHLYCKTSRAQLLRRKMSKMVVPPLCRSSSFATQSALPKESSNRKVGRPRASWTLNTMSKTWNTMRQNDPLLQNQEFNKHGRNISEQIIAQTRQYLLPFRLKKSWPQFEEISVWRYLRVKTTQCERTLMWTNSMGTNRTWRSRCACTHSPFSEKTGILLIFSFVPVKKWKTPFWGVRKHFHHEVGWRQGHGARCLAPIYDKKML